MSARARLSTLHGGHNDFPQRTPLASQLHFSSLDACEFHQTFDEAIEPVSLFIDNLKHLLPSLFTKRRRLRAILRRKLIVKQSRDRGFDRSQRRTQIMSHGVEQSRFELFTLLQCLCLTRAFKRVLQFVVKPFDFLTRCFGFFGSLARARGQLSDGDRSYEKGEKGNPIFGFGNGEGAEGRKKEEVKARYAHQRSQHRGFGSPGSGDKEND